MGIKELPICVWLFLQIVMLPFSLVALPVLALLTACQGSITASVFEKGSGQTALHALLAPFRLVAVVGMLATLAAVPASGVWLAHLLFASGGVLWSVILATAAAIVVVGGAAWILSGQGIFSYLPAWSPLRVGDLAAGVVDSIADLAAAACSLFVVATIIRLPWLVIAACGKSGEDGDRRSKQDHRIVEPRATRSMRRKVVVQAAFAVVDWLLMPFVLALLCTIVRLPRLMHQLRRAEKQGPGERLSCAAVMNSWPARAAVFTQALHLLFVDILLVPLCGAVICSLYRLRYLVLDFKEAFELERRRQPNLGFWSILGKDLEAQNGRILSVFGQLEFAVLSQFTSLLLDVLVLPLLLLVVVTVWRVPTTVHGVQAKVRKGVGPSVDETLRYLDSRAVELRLIVVWEALKVIVLDVPTFVAASLNILLVYRSVAVCKDVCSEKRTTGSDRAEDSEGLVTVVMHAQTAAELRVPPLQAPRSATSRYDKDTATQMRMRAVVWGHLLLTILDVLTLGAFLILVVTMYRLPKTMRKLGGYENVWNRTGRHWSTFSLHIDVPRNRGFTYGTKCTPRRANFYILKRAAKVLTDIAIAVPLIACALIPWKLPLIIADLRLLLWYKAPEGRATTRMQYTRRTPGLILPEQPRETKPRGCILGNQLHKPRASKGLKDCIRASWMLGIVAASIVAFVIHWSAIKLFAANIVPNDWCQSNEMMEFEGGSSSAASANLVIGDACMLGVLAVPILVACCCCCCCCCVLHILCDGDMFEYGVEAIQYLKLEDGMRRTVRYGALQRLVYLHFLLLPIDLCVEPICLVFLLVLKVTRWRYAPLDEDAGTSLTVAGWIAERPDRYLCTAWHTIQWLLDFPAVLMLLILIITLLRAHDVIMDLIHFSKPNRSSQAHSYYQRSQESYNRLRNGVAAITDDDETSLVRNRKFPEDLSPALARAERRLAVAKLLSDRLTSSMDENIPFLPLEAIECIAKYAVPVIRVPQDWLLAQDALTAAPPDATILLNAGVHRIELPDGMLMQHGDQHSVSEITIEGTGGSAGDVIVIPILRSNQTSIGSVSMLNQAHGALGRCPDGFLKNVTVILEPAAVRGRSFSDQTEVTEWRQLVWRNGALLLLELPFPILALLCLWRIPELIQTLRAKDRIFDEYTRISLTLNTILKAILDIPAFAALLLMTISGWRVPSLLRARQNHSASHSVYRTIASEFCVWLCDLPFAVLCIVLLPFVWRTAHLLKTLWNVGNGLGSDRTEVWRTAVTPTQRILVARCALLCILDLLCIVSLPLLVLFPWRGIQCPYLIRYESMCSRVESFGERQLFNTNAKHRTCDSRPRPSPLRNFFGFETSLIRSRLEVHAVQFREDASAVHGVVLQQADIEAAKNTGPEPEPEAGMPFAATTDVLVAQDGWIEPREAVTFAVLYCAYKSLADLWRLLEIMVILVLGFRHLPFLYRELKKTITQFRTARQFLDRYDNWDFIDEEVKLCNLLCCLPLLFCWCMCCTDDSWTGARYVGQIEESSYTGNLERQRHQNAPDVPTNFRYGQTLLLSVSPSFSSTMLHPGIDKTFAKTVWDIPHLLLLPIKLLAVILAPSYFYLKWRFKSAVSQGVLTLQADDHEGQLAVPEVVWKEGSRLQPIVSVFLLPCRPIVERNPTGLSFWNAHETGIVFLLATPLCVLDFFALMYVQVTCIIFAWPLTLMGPLWDTHRHAAGVTKLGSLLPKGLTSSRLHAVHNLMIFVQALSSPVLLVWILVSSCGPLLLWMDVVDDLMRLLPVDWSNSGSGSGSATSELLGHVSALSGGIWFAIGSVVWLLVAIGGCALAMPYCTRHFPLFSPRRACVILVKKIAAGRLMKLYSTLLIRATVWSYTRRGAEAMYIGEFVIPVVAFVWAFWPAMAVVLPALVIGHCYPVSDGACSESTWATPFVVIYFVIPGCISIRLAVECLSVLRRHWRQPLTTAELAELARPHVELQAVRLRCPDDGVGIIVEIDVRKDRAFAASRVRLQVISGDPVWEALGRPLSASARMLLPYVRGSLLPFDLAQYDCMQTPSRQLRSGEVVVSLAIRVGCTGQPMATKVAEMRPFAAQLASNWGDAPDMRLRLEYPTQLGWANLTELSFSPGAMLQALQGIEAPGEVNEIVGVA